MKSSKQIEQELAEAESRGEKFGLPSWSEVLAKKTFANVETGPKSATQLKQERLTRTVADVGVRMIEWFKTQIREKKNLQQEWDNLEFADKYVNGNTVCPLLKGAPRLARGKEVDPTKMLAARDVFLANTEFAPYREVDDSQTARFQLQRKIVGEIVDFMAANKLDAEQAGAWSFSFAILKNAEIFGEPQPKVVAPAPEPLSPTEQAEAKYKARMTEIVVYDPLTNAGYTEFDLENKVDSKTELRLRRLMEGNIGNERYTEYMNRKDWQAKQAEQVARGETQ